MSDPSLERPPPGDDRDKRRWIRLLLAIALISGAVAVVSYLQGQRSQEIVFDGFDGQDQLRLADLRGEPVLINFFASWCIPCRQEMPLVEQAHLRHRDAVVFLGVDLRDNVEQARALIEETNITYRVVADPDGTAYGALVANAQTPTRLAMPFTAFIDQHGDVVHTHAGLMTEDQLERLIRQHLR